MPNTSDANQTSPADWFESGVSSRPDQTTGLFLGDLGKRVVVEGRAEEHPFWVVSRVDPCENPPLCSCRVRSGTTMTLLHRFRGDSTLGGTTFF